VGDQRPAVPNADAQYDANENIQIINDCDLINRQY
jgi:hypothetical protein